MTTTEVTSLLEPFQDQFRTSIVSVDTSSDMVTITIEKASVVPVFTYLYSEAGLSFQFLTDLCGIHFPDQNPPALGVVYHLHSLTRNIRLRIKTFTPVSEPTVPSLTPVFESANWMERETYDFFGIIFKGHPNLIRILNMDEMTDFPMRKEFPLEEATRSDKDDTFFGRKQNNAL